jgi:hypothetical protein
VRGALKPGPAVAPCRPLAFVGAVLGRGGVARALAGEWDKRLSLIVEKEALVVVEVSVLGGA